MPSRSELHYPALDGLRGMAALMIVWRHFLQLVPMHGRTLSALSLITGFTWIGVDLFFVLSGFLITGILADSKSKKNYFRSFYGRRVLRIFPLYYAVLAVVLLVFPAIGVHTGVSPNSEFSFWTYTCNFYFAYHGWFANYLTHFWTLAIEEQFYLLWPLVIFFVRDVENLRRSLPWVVFAVLLLRIVLFLSGFDAIWLSLITFTHCDGLLLGGYLALAIRSRSPRALNGLRPSKLILSLFLLLTLLVLNESGLFSAWDALPIVSFVRSMITLPLWAIIFVWLIYAAAMRTSGRIYSFFSHRWMRWFGKYSYGLYVLHMPLGFLILQSVDLSQLSPARTLLAEAGLFFSYIGACIACAFLSWHLYEKQFLKLKRYFQAG